MLRRIHRRMKNIQRSRHIANVLIKHGFGHVIERLDLKLPLVKKAAKEVDIIPAPVRARMVLEELGPTFIKFGQLLSMRPELIPEEYTEEFRKLQDMVPGFGYEDVESQIEDELGAPVNELFDSFEKEAFAAASICQVHRAVYDGEDVVVKVQRPGIEEIVESDLDILFNLAHLASKHIPECRVYDPVGIVEEFAKAIRKELDFMVEARNAEKFKKNFAEDLNVLIPRVYWDATGKKILTLEEIKGTKISELPAETDAETRKRLADDIARAYMKQILADGFFHADPHPGNLFLTEDGRIAFIDFGIVGRVDEYLKEKLASLFIALIKKDVKQVVDTILDIGVTGEETSIPDFRSDIGELIEEYYGTDLRNVRVSAMLNDVMKVAMKHCIKIPANFALLIKTLMILESICRDLSAEFNLTEISGPYVETMIAERIQPKRIMEKFMGNLSEINEFVMVIPRRLSQILAKLQEGKLVIDLEHKGLNRLIAEIDASSNRLSAAMIIAAIIVGSSVVILADKGPHFLGFPLVGVIGFVIAGVLGFLLVLSILRSGKF